MVEVDWVEGETAPRDFLLTVNGLAFDGTGLTVELMVKDRTGVAVDMAGDVLWADQAGGMVQVLPDAADFTVAKSGMLARFKVTDGTGRKGYFPRGEKMLWLVWPE